MNHHKLPQIPLTKQAFEENKKQLKILEAEQEQILIRLQTAREMGDLSENGAYKYAKFELGNLRRKLRQVRYLVRYGVIKEKNADGIVDFGNTITLKHDQGELTFTLVSKHESNPTQKKLSTDSPIGQAVLGKKLNETIIIQVPAGEKTYTITKIT